MANDKEFNPYEVLGVNKDTPMDDIKKAFKNRSKELHPDKGGTPEDFNNLKKAFDILTDPAKRNLYDEYGIDDALDIENEAKLVAVQIVVSALDGLPDSCDVDKEISAIFQRCLNGLTQQEEAAKKARDKLQRRLDSIQKKPVNDFLTNEILRVIETHNKAMKQAQLNYRIHDTAFCLVREYKFDITKIPFMGGCNSWEK
jgi:DnaJ-class molecular chaperone